MKIKKIKKSIIIIFVLTTMLNIQCYALQIQPRYVPTEVNMTFWDINYHQEKTSVYINEVFAIKLDLGGGTGTYEISIDFGDGHTLHESSFTGYTFITTYNYHTTGTKTIEVEVNSIGTVNDSKNILVKDNG